MLYDDNNGKPPGPGPGLHFLKALGHAALAWGEVAFAEQDDEEDTEAAPQAFRRSRKRFKLSAPTGGKPARGSCCLGKRR